MIEVDQRGTGLIGDGLGVVPFLMAVAEKHGGPVLINEDFSPAIRPLLSEIPIQTTDMLLDPFYKIDVGKAFTFAHSGNNVHMAQSYFKMTGFGEPPALPVTLPLVSAPSPVPPGGVVISPFSVSDNQHNKCWFEDRWSHVIRAVQDKFHLPVYVIGGAKDHFEPYVAAGATAIVGQPLTSILSALRECRLFVSVDNGMSHLAHFGGVRHHILLYPICLSPSWVPNPGARIIRNHPIEISVETVLSHVYAALG